jgi:hypothetical protein
MKRKMIFMIVIIVVFTGVAIIRANGGKGGGGGGGTFDCLVETKSQYIFSNINAYRDPVSTSTATFKYLTDFFLVYEDATIDVKITGTSSCKYEKSTRYYKSNVDDNGFRNVTVPITPYSVKFTVTTPCTYNYVLSANVILVWDKTINNQETTILDFGRPVKQDCTPTRTVAGRSSAVENYATTGRVSSGSARTTATR